MSKTYTPGSEADAIIARQIARGDFSTPDEVVRAAVQLLDQYNARLESLRTEIEEGVQAFERGEYTACTSEDQFLADISPMAEPLTSLGGSRGKNASTDGVTGRSSVVSESRSNAVSSTLVSPNMRVPDPAWRQPCRFNLGQTSWLNRSQIPLKHHMSAP